MVNNGYRPVTAVWEVTMGCNMRCGHCGSSCAGPLPGELSTEEALDLCDQIAELGLKWITLSGGEPLTRKDTPDLIKRLTANGVSVNIITNGWLLTEEMARKIKENGIATAAISIDGTPEIHDKIRKEGAFEHARRAFAAMKEQGIDTGAVTTITKQNIGILRWRTRSGGKPSFQESTGITTRRCTGIVDVALTSEKNAGIRKNFRSNKVHRQV